MQRNSVRAGLRGFQSFQTQLRPLPSKRFITTEAPHLRSRSWKSSALRWGIAIAGIYYYNTSPVFGEHPQNNLLNPNVDAIHDDTDSRTTEILTASSRQKKQRDASILQSAVETASGLEASERGVTESQNITEMTSSPPAAGSVAELEEEAESEGAFNPATGEINWDCPCLGGMAYGPCGPEFKEAFSCFVYSKEEPKGMECIDKFQAMQTCFRAHPEVYKGEIEDDEELDESLAHQKEELQQEISDRRAAVEARQSESSSQQAQPSDGSTKSEKSTREDTKSKESSVSKDVAKSDSEPQPEAKVTRSGYEKEHEHGAASYTVKSPNTKAVAEDAVTESESLVPKSAHDAR